MPTKPAEQERTARKKSAPSPAVLHVITTAARRGAETFAVDLVEALADRGRPGRTVALTADGLEGLAVPALGRRRMSLPTLRALRREARRARVVVAHGSSAVAACALATFASSTPFVYRNIGDPAFWLDTSRRRRRMRWILRRARVTVALWDESAAHLRELAGADIDVRIIPTGVPARLFAPADATAKRRARRRLGLAQAGIVAIYVGSLSSEKSVTTAIQAVARIPDATLLVVGDGPDRPGLQTTAETLAPGRVVFLGARQRPSDELAAADVLVLTSRTEGIPAVLIEAAFSGLPVVASAVGGIPEVVEHGRTGLVVPAGDVGAFSDAIRDAATDTGAMGRVARERCIERFEIGVVARAWDSLLDDLGAWSPTR